MKIYVLNDYTKNGVNTIEGFIEYQCKYNNKITEHKYFKLQHDISVNDYDYSESDITEEQEEIIHDKIINNDYNYITEGNEEILYNYIKSALWVDNKSDINKVKEIGLNGNKIKIWINSKRFIHIIKRDFNIFNDGKKRLCDNEFMFNKNKVLKEIDYSILEY